MNKKSLKRSVYMGGLSCCFIGHRKINETEALRNLLSEIIEDLIVSKNVDTFLFGSKSAFNNLCLEVVDGAKEKHANITRIYVRAEYPEISKEYENYLLESYEDTYFPERAIGAGSAVYVERNFEMIDKSDFCIIYYDEEYKPKSRKSGTEIAMNYAERKNKRIIKLGSTVRG